MDREFRATLVLRDMLSSVVKQAAVVDVDVLCFVDIDLITSTSQQHDTRWSMTAMMRRGDETRQYIYLAVASILLTFEVA